MSSSDPKRGGDLFDMAKDGTSIPSDAGTQNAIPSVPRPDQTIDDSTSPDIASAADNNADIPRGPQDSGATGEVVTGTGDQLPATVETKRLGTEAATPAAKGHPRDAKHGKQESEFETVGGEGAEVVPAPGEEEEEQDVIRDRKGA